MQSVRKVGRSISTALIIFFTSCGTPVSQGNLANGGGAGSGSSAAGGSALSFTGIDAIDTVAATSMSINWTHVAGADNYLVYRVNGDESLTLLSTLAAPTATYSVTGLTAATTYRFLVRLLDSDGLSDGNTNIVTQATTSVAFVPSDLASLQMWLDAGDMNGNGDSNTGWSDSDPVASWVDRTGNGHNAAQGNAANRPTYNTAVINGEPVVTFDASGACEYLTIPNDAIFQLNNGGVGRAITIAMVFRMVDNDGQNIFINKDRSTGRDWVLELFDAGFNSMTFLMFGDKSSNTSWTGRTTTDGFDAVSNHILVTTYSGGALATDLKMYTDGSQVDTTTVNAAGTWDGLSDNTTNDVEIGGRPNFAGFEWCNDKAIAEILWFTEELSAGNRGDLETYLNNKYAVY